MRKFIARQPILDANQKTFGFELLFRSGMESYFRAVDPDMASSSLIVDSFLLFGMQTLTDGRRAFINFTRKLIVDRCPTFLPENQLVIEILESVEPDAEVIAACKAMHRMGYRFALDDFSYSHAHRPLLDFVDFIKVDFLSSPVSERCRLAKEFGALGIGMVAERVETHQQYREAVDMGYQFYQGYFFSRPQLLSRRDIPAFKINYQRLLHVVHSPNPEFSRIEEIIKAEPSLCFKLLRYLNSALFAFSGEIHSIRYALSLLGLKELNRWISLISLTGLCEDKPPALIINSMIRAKLCELLARPTGMGNRGTDLFLTGLLSMIDSMLDRPMREIINQLSLGNDVQEALISKNSSRIRQVLDLAIAWERGDWAEVSGLAVKLGLDESQLAEIHLQAVEWGNQVFHLNQLAPVC
jgi:c-di-GMP-related signal transduction protein